MTRISNQDSSTVPVTECSICRRTVLIGESLTPYEDGKSERLLHVCQLCREAANERGWISVGEPLPRKGHGSRMRVEHISSNEASNARFSSDTAVELERDQQDSSADGDRQDSSAEDMQSGAESGREKCAGNSVVRGAYSATADEQPIRRETFADIDNEPAKALLARVSGELPVFADPSPELLDRIRRQDSELARLRRELDPQRSLEQQNLIEQQAAEIAELRTQLRQRELQVERLQQARHAETSPLRMSRFALDAFNQSKDFERMARIARTLGDPVINIHDEGAGIPRRIRLTLSWDIAWYEFVVKIDLGVGQASVHETDSGGDPDSLPLERRRSNADWRESGIVL